MISTIDTITLSDKDYEQFRREAVEQIPIYNTAWTNHNVSDPGITILENLSAFTALLQSEIDIVPEKVKWKLLALAGFVPREGRPAVAYVKPTIYSDGEGLTGEKIYVHDICYEPEPGWRFIKAFFQGIYAAPDPNDPDRIENYDLLASSSYGIAGGVQIWGEKPAKGARLYFLIDRLYRKQNTVQKLILSFNIGGKYRRNPMEEGSHNPFVAVRWEILTESGFCELEAEDSTCCFLQSGYVMLKTELTMDRLRRVPGEEGKEGYCIRATLVKAAYDIAPVVERAAGPLVRIRQTDTLSALSVVASEEDLYDSVNETLLQNGESMVLLSADNYFSADPSLPQANLAIERSSIFYRLGPILAVDSPDSVDAKKRMLRRLLRDRAAKNEGLLIISRDRRILPYTELGVLYGYDEQELELPPMQRVYSQDFSLILRCSAEQVRAFLENSAEYPSLPQANLAIERGSVYFHMVGPNAAESGEVLYSVLEQENKLVIHDCGCFEGAEVLLGNYAVYQGIHGNVRVGTAFGGAEGSVFKNYARGIGGRYQDTLEQTRKRFVRDLNTPAAAVTAADCEQLVKGIPGLSLSKVKAYAEEGTNRIHIAVRPNSDRKYPRLSGIYIKIIRSYMEERRLLSTQIIVESPVYVSINVHLSVRVKKAYTQAEKRIQEALNRLFGSAYDAFGATVYFHDIYEKIQGLEFIEEIYELSLDADRKRACHISGAGITLAKNAVCCGGKYRIDITG